jgi:hypothetical protein
MKGKSKKGEKKIIKIRKNERKKKHERKKRKESSNVRKHTFFEL